MLDDRYANPCLAKNILLNVFCVLGNSLYLPPQGRRFYCHFSSKNTAALGRKDINKLVHLREKQDSTLVQAERYLDYMLRR